MILNAGTLSISGNGMNYWFMPVDPTKDWGKDYTAGTGWTSPLPITSWDRETLKMAVSQKSKLDGLIPIYKRQMTGTAGGSPDINFW